MVFQSKQIFFFPYMRPQWLSNQSDEAHLVSTGMFTKHTGLTGVFTQTYMTAVTVQSPPRHPIPTNRGVHSVGTSTPSFQWSVCPFDPLSITAECGLVGTHKPGACGCSEKNCFIRAGAGSGESPPEAERPAVVPGLLSLLAPLSSKYGLNFQTFRDLSSLGGLTDASEIIGTKQVVRVG